MLYARCRKTSAGWPFVVRIPTRLRCRCAPRSHTRSRCSAYSDSPTAPGGCKPKDNSPRARKKRNRQASGPSSRGSRRIMFSAGRGVRMTVSRNERRLALWHDLLGDGMGIELPPKGQGEIVDVEEVGRLNAEPTPIGRSRNAVALSSQDCWRKKWLNINSRRSPRLRRHGEEGPLHMLDSLSPRKIQGNAASITPRLSTFHKWHVP